MADEDDTRKLYEQIEVIVKQLGDQQTMLYALLAYLDEQPFYDAAKFGLILQEFKTDLTAALTRRSRAAPAAWLKLLKDFEGPAH